MMTWSRRLKEVRLSLSLVAPAGLRKEHLFSSCFGLLADGGACAEESLACSKALRRRPVAEEMRGVETSRVEKSSPQKWSRSASSGKAYAKSAC